MSLKSRNFSGNLPRTKGVLVLESLEKDSAPVIFEGLLMGAPLELKRSFSQDRGYGEVVFNTSMTGYQEILTDPSYYGQMICMTAPHIGNYGVNLEDQESKGPRCAGLLVHSLSDRTSNWRATDALESYLIKNNIPGLTQVDTRALTLYLRDRGVVRGLILSKDQAQEGQEILRNLPVFEGRDLIREVSTREPYRWNPAGGKKKYRVVALDYGIKWNLLRCLDLEGCEVEVLPATSTAEEILNRRPDGVFLSNGPGDPSAAPYAVETVRGLLGKVPIFGVCMGHQILALALGARTYKLKFGHRGGNHPVLDFQTGKVEISAQNHGYAVDEGSLPKSVRVTHVSLNDRTVEGLAVDQVDAFSVQYHPEASPGPHDSGYLFNRFIKTMEKNVRKIS
jgi:carbamoyl-phosphate synthase small subunit